MKRILTLVAATFTMFLNSSAQIKNIGTLSTEDIKSIISAPENLSDSLFDKLTSHTYIIESPTLRTIGKNHLPPSLWGFVTKEDCNYHQLKSSNIKSKTNVTLCWTGCIDSIADDIWRKKLQKKYGTITTHDGKTMVPATWVNDTLYCATRPACHNGLWTANSYPEYYVRKGSASHIEEDFQPKEADKGKFTLRDAVMDLREDLFSILDGDGRQAREAKKQELTLLAYEIYRQDTLSARKYDREDRPLLIHVYMAPEGSLQCDILNKDQLSTSQINRDVWLQSAFSKISNIYIRPRRTLYGKILPGIVLKAIRPMTYWVFEEP